ncbi:MAG: hypothetical protein MK105_13625, partial [Crocinitomicaceae bacterium]|nr:hypothetical protein [Crocinitomicaceae bacterium]
SRATPVACVPFRPLKHLYIAIFTAEYVKYYVESNKDGTYQEGGHGKNDESGKVADQFGDMKDTPSPNPEIKREGN